MATNTGPGRRIGKPKVLGPRQKRIVNYVPPAAAMFEFESTRNVDFGDTIMRLPRGTYVLIPLEVWQKAAKAAMQAGSIVKGDLEN